MRNVLECSLISWPETKSKSITLANQKENTENPVNQSTLEVITSS